MKLAIIYEDNNICVEFSPYDFKRLLKKYFKESGNIEIAFEKVCEELKKKVLYK